VAAADVCNQACQNWDGHFCFVGTSGGGGNNGGGDNGGGDNGGGDNGGGGSGGDSGGGGGSGGDNGGGGSCGDDGAHCNDYTDPGQSHECCSQYCGGEHVCMQPRSLSSGSACVWDDDCESNSCSLDKVCD
jgi:hypothetical protein